MSFATVARLAIDKHCVAEVIIDGIGQNLAGSEILEKYLLVVAVVGLDDNMIGSLRRPMCHKDFILEMWLVAVVWPIILDDTVGLLD